MKKIIKGLSLIAAVICLCAQTVLATTYTYDAVKRLTTVGYDDGVISVYQFDKRGNIISVKSTTTGVIIFDYESAEQKIDSITVKTGEAIPSLPQISRKGHKFAGWYTEEGDRVQQGDTVDFVGELTLYAHWDSGEHEYMSRISQKATCTEAGIRTYTCVDCGDSKIEAIPAFGHDYKAEEEIGRTVYTCEHCGEDYCEVKTAYEWYYNGSSPYQIAQADELCAFAALTNGGVSFEGKTVELCANITADLEAPIGTSEHPFKGTFDGNGHEITLDSAASGVFSCIGEAGTVINLSVNAEIAAADKTVGMIADVNNGKIQNCAARGLIASEDGTVGGIAGQNNGTIYNCMYDGDISYNEKLASKCVNQDNGEYLWDVTNEAWGAICGQNNGNMTHCFYGIEDDINNPKHSGVNGTGKYNTMHMYTGKYYIFGFFAGFKYVGYELDEQAQQNENFVRWNAEKETCPTLQSR